MDMSYLRRSESYSPANTFFCRQEGNGDWCMQADAAAEKHLSRFSPSLRGRGAVVNVGPFTCGGLGLAKLMGTRGEDQVLYDPDLDG